MSNSLQAQTRRIQLLIQRYLRRFAERLVKRDGGYSADRVGADETRKVLGVSWDQRNAQRVMDELGVPSLEHIEDALTEALPDDAPIMELARRFDLDDTLRDALLVAAAPRLSTDLSRLFTVAIADYEQRVPPLGFVADVAAPDDAARVVAACTPSGEFHSLRLVGLEPRKEWSAAGGRTPLWHKGLTVPESVVRMLAGLPNNNLGLSGTTLHRDGKRADELLFPEDVVSQLVAALREGEHLVLLGPRGLGRRSALCSLVTGAGEQVLEVDLAVTLSSPRAADILLDAIRDARMLNAALLLRFDGLDDTPPSPVLVRTVRMALAGSSRPVLGTGETRSALITAFLGDVPLVSVPLPARQDQQEFWERTLARHVTDEKAEAWSLQLAHRYSLPPGRIVDTVEGGIRRARLDPKSRRAGLQLRHVEAAMQGQLGDSLGVLAAPVKTGLRIDDLVLPEDTRERLYEVLRYAKNAEKVFGDWDFDAGSTGGRGLSVLLSGKPGTGKTLTASILARELGRVLYRVDLSRIVDKYIGETEKNLARAFDEAERAQAILLFDEADSLFSARTAVKSSNDRYANLEVNFLLQRLESFPGMTILTTNFAQSIDEAFQRRIRFKISYPMPDEDARAQLWRRLLPSKAPIEEDIDWIRLGEDYELSGGHIRNAVLRAAISAADQDRPIDEDLLVESAIAECRELGVLVLNQQLGAGGESLAD